jgi:hypothetical protein
LAGHIIGNLFGMNKIRCEVINIVDIGVL